LSFADVVLSLVCVARWTKAFRAAHGKELTADSTFEMERRRQVPIRYDRELMATTIRAMSRIAEIRAARQVRLHQQRMKVKKAVEREAVVRELRVNAELINAPVVSAERRTTLNNLRDKQRTTVDSAAARNVTQRSSESKMDDDDMQ
jgi:large subunit ribosomal protein L24e